MKYFQNLLLLGISFSTILFCQSIEIPHAMIEKDGTLNVPIFIYNVSNLESIQLTIEYDDSIISAEDIVKYPPLGILDERYTIIDNPHVSGLIIISIGSDSPNLFSGSGMVSQIIFKSIGNLGEFSDVTLSDVQINELWPAPAVDGAIEIMLPFSLTITGQDISDIGAEHSITLGLCEGCRDGWKFGEDEADYPDPQVEYTNIHFYHPEWKDAQDENGNDNDDQTNFSTDYRKPHYINELTTNWGIRGSTGNGLEALNIPIKLSWDSNKLNDETSDNFKIFIYVGETRHDMKEQNSIIISQSELNISNNEPNIWIKTGGCPETGETVTYYQDSDGDDLGNNDITEQHCSGDQPDGWVSNNSDQNDEVYCLSNNIDDCKVCDGFNGDKDCSGECFGALTEDSCGVCNGNNDCVDCNGIAHGDSVIDCNEDCDGSAIEDNCGICDSDFSNDCVPDCSGDWGGNLEYDECGVCGGNENNGNDICDNICSLNNEAPDCNGDCDGGAYRDDCGICVGGLTGNIACIPDCNGELGGTAEVDECEICVGGLTGKIACLEDCNGDWGGPDNTPNSGDEAIIDECGICGGSGIGYGECDCDGNVDLGCGCGTAGPSGCDNTCGSTLTVDVCGVCGGDGIPDGACDCNGNVEDCTGVCSGLAFTDDCGVCDTDNTNDNQCVDCNGTVDGLAKLDNCNECILEGENTTCEMDCNGDWGGPDNIPDSGDEAVVDECNICGGNENNGNNVCDIICPQNNATPDCNGDCDGDAYTDDCGICVGGQTGNIACIPDCNGEWGGSAIEDDCGVCDTDNTNNNQCVDCNGTVNGFAELNNCGDCIEDLSDSSYECEQDCDGIWGGNHPPTFSCENGNIVCNYNACFDLANNQFQLPQRFDISRIYPNPFNPQATIDFEVSEPTIVQLNIYNLNGQKVNVLQNAFTLPGYYSVIWNGTNHPSGIYFVILQSSNSVVKQKMMLIK